MNYEKAYKDALNEATIAYKDEDKHLKVTLERIFPELKEKTDEEMIQKLIAVVHLYYGEGVDIERDECLEWLEKQSKQTLVCIDKVVNFLNENLINDKDEVTGEPFINFQNYGAFKENFISYFKRKMLENKDELKHIERKEFTTIPFGAFDSELIEEILTIPDGCVATMEGNKIHIKKEGKTALEAIKEEKVDNANKVEPKFKVGDWIVSNNHNSNNVLLIIDVYKTNYKITTQQGSIDVFTINYIDEYYHLWSITDAKDGDVLISWTNKPFIYNGFFNEGVVGAYCGLNTFNRIIIPDKQDYLYYNWTIKKHVRPATKEQRDILFKKMKENGYEWNADKKELKKLN